MLVWTFGVRTQANTQVTELRLNKLLLNKRVLKLFGLMSDLNDYHIRQ